MTPKNFCETYYPRVAELTTATASRAQQHSQSLSKQRDTAVAWFDLLGRLANVDQRFRPSGADYRQYGIARTSDSFDEQIPGAAAAVERMAVELRELATLAQQQITRLEKLATEMRGSTDD